MDDRAEKFYVGIGSRKTPREILRLIYEFAIYLARTGWTLRSGRAEGADQAFEKGAKDGYGPTEIFHPEDATAAALELAAKYHPAWDRCNEYARKLLARDCHQVLGYDLKTPAKFIFCWTPDGSIGITTRETGGTGQAIRVAKANNIPIYNLARPEHLIIIKKKIGWL